MHLVAHEGPQDKLPCLSILVRESSLFSSRNTVMATAYLKIKVYCLLKDVGWNIRWPERLMSKNGCLISPSGCANMGGGRGQKKAGESRSLSVPQGMNIVPWLSGTPFHLECSPQSLPPQTILVLLAFFSHLDPSAVLLMAPWIWLILTLNLKVFVDDPAIHRHSRLQGERGGMSAWSLRMLYDHCACSGNTCV